MIAGYTHRRAPLVCAMAISLVFGLIVACGSGDLVVGDDTSDGAGPSPEGSAVVDGSSPPDMHDAATDTKSDGPPGSCAAAPGGPGMCLPMGTACRQADTTGLTCPSSGGFCCLTPCPELAQPPPGFCDGGPYAPTYDAKACITGFECAPVSCTTAGGACVGLSPSSCPNGHFGDATKYSCGGGVGVACCLP